MGSKINNVDQIGVFCVVRYSTIEKNLIQCISIQVACQMYIFSRTKKPTSVSWYLCCSVSCNDNYNFTVTKLIYDQLVQVRGE